MIFAQIPIFKMCEVFMTNVVKAMRTKKHTCNRIRHVLLAFSIHFLGNNLWQNHCFAQWRNLQRWFTCRHMTVWCVEYMIHIEKSTFMSKCKAQCIEKSFMCSRCIVDYKYRAQNKRRQFAAIIFLFHMAEVWRSKKVHFGRNIRTINCQCTRNWSILSKINPVPEEHRRKSGAILLTKIWNGFFIFYLFSINENSFFCDREETDRDDFLDA